MHNIWTEINQKKKLKSTSVTIFQDKSEKKSIPSYILLNITFHENCKD